MGKEYLLTIIQEGDVIRKRKISREELIAELHMLLDSLLKGGERHMSVIVQIPLEDLTFIYETLAKLRDKRKKEAQRIQKILKQLDEEFCKVEVEVNRD